MPHKKKTPLFLVMQRAALVILVLGAVQLVATVSLIAGALLGTAVLTFIVGILLEDKHRADVSRAFDHNPFTENAAAEEKAGTAQRAPRPKRATEGSDE